MARDEQADDEGEDAIDEADRLTLHSRVNCNARDKRPESALPAHAICASLCRLEDRVSALMFCVPLLAFRAPLLVCAQAYDIYM
jgi:hypothetical protein